MKLPIDKIVTGSKHLRKVDEWLYEKFYSDRFQKKWKATEGYNKGRMIYLEDDGHYDCFCLAWSFTTDLNAAVALVEECERVFWVFRCHPMEPVSYCISVGTPEEHPKFGTVSKEHELTVKCLSDIPTALIRCLLRAMGYSEIEVEG